MTAADVRPEGVRFFRGLFIMFAIEVTFALLAGAAIAIVYVCG
ncbi:hypothetical protein [Subtercola sp. RTI3]|nr:hypothetical protein [Subtercola sp. RTI3]MEA9983689.1 hypothetical protein [Subtercola sp. RTI3]